MLATGSDADEKLLGMLCQRVERLLRMAISDWYGYLSREALSVDTWRYGVPWWVKRVPDKLDLQWALVDLRKSAGSRGMLMALYTSVDESVLSLKRDEEILHNPPKIDLLHEALKELCDVVGV
tara:strand:- start:5240 stop:5608 length:369 start_codon:yes stop_codon:yes gene_type:complete